MGCGGYEISLELSRFMIAEDNKLNQWTDEASHKTSPQAITLEDEIRLLRSKMELLFQQEKSFTSDIVIEISRLLDLKINEFMLKSQNYKKK
ncbi:Spo0E like sporulation regulatory protein [Fontibacillus panacisegetis]|uniref:Spo0E like sporulation regulatory protein n=1 Tax=Fontibacillus panacisegetis TaxID=670482 RepID=A0A1G7PDG4_9BACL|nr:aspartyl-phosphate phosphatase Spo0E family protein [Fontibacillus panacisegetis]SDF83659.1 Spo0E like sporulation regulatory protein [Fontibacillus panacisegetis]